MIRVRIGLLFALCLVVALWQSAREGRAADERELRRYQRCRSVTQELLNRNPGIYSDEERARLRDGVQRLQTEIAAWTRDPAAAQAGAEIALTRIRDVLDRSGHTARVWLPAVPAALSRSLPYSSGTVVLHLARPGDPADTVADFVSRDADASNPEAAVVDTGDATRIYAVLFLDNLKPGAQNVSLKLAAGPRTIGFLRLEVRTPGAGRLKVSLSDGRTGAPTAAAVGLYAPDNQLVTPAEALSFAEGGFTYPDRSQGPRVFKVRPYRQVRSWPGGAGQHHAFFVDGEFSVEAPEGEYTLIAGKGPEYLPQVRKVRIRAGEQQQESVRLERWIDMPAKGWYSGDGHVHYARAGAEANARLLRWARAEDAHLVNVLRMGDALETYFEQYGFGRSGRHVEGIYAIVPGQEDPRTSSHGHTIQLNLQQPVRHPGRYYLYDLVFDDVRKQGGLTGYAHVYQPAAMGFFVRQDMTLNVARGKIDFAEIAEFGDIDSQLYYEFLNLGYKLTASAGSDVPWGHTIGTSRVYAYTGTAFDPDAWLSAVRTGRTFVTTGPMLEFTVNGQIAGADIRAKPGDRLRIKARAMSPVVPPRFLEVVAQGDVVRAARPPVQGGDWELDFTLPVTHSTWLAARCAGAHTSPVYVHVNGARFWKVGQVEELVKVRGRQLDDIEEMVRRGVPEGHRGGWNHPAVLTRNAEELRERVASVRKLYEDLAQEARRELAARSAAPK